MSVQANDIIEIRGLKIDKTARRVWVDGTEKAFTTKEFDLLTFLAQNPNHVFTKDELFKEIWDMESIGDIATVTVHIKKIREKIEKNSAKPQYIETIWGVGYRFKNVRKSRDRRGSERWRLYLRIPRVLVCRKEAGLAVQSGTRRRA